jgi:hypothetical protein
MNFVSNISQAGRPLYESIWINKRCKVYATKK